MGVIVISFKMFTQKVILRLTVRMLKGIIKEFVEGRSMAIKTRVQLPTSPPESIR